MASSERVRNASFALAAGLVCAAGAGSCRVDIPEDALFMCTSDADCGDTGAVCRLGGRTGYCCLRASEVCDGRDNDCDGRVDEDLVPESCYSGPAGTQDVGICRAGLRICAGGSLSMGCEMEVLPSVELCNLQDDDCDGQIDEGFALQSDPFHCGTCSIACSASEQCKNGTCIPSSETSCGNGLDDNDDGLTDCNDPECQGRSCGAGCLCGGGVRREAICLDAVDNDGDALKDCSDPDCQGLSCGSGCECEAGNKSEANCRDSTDNDGDAVIDCADADCAGRSCGAGCLCPGNIAETDCHDGTDNDGDTHADCADPDCVGRTCRSAPATMTCDAQAFCSCNGVASPPPESSCADGSDQDCDGLVDCADADCTGLSCGNGCACRDGLRGEMLCSDALDNDGDGSVDCADPNCDLASCGSGCTCRDGLPSETACADAADNDRDGLVDCADPGCNLASCGTGCTCQNGERHEMTGSCSDQSDNDGDAKIDCEDSADCPRGTPCEIVNGAAVKWCQAGNKCGTGGPN